MSTPWKVLLALALVLPAGAFVVGSFVASAAEDPAPRQTIILEQTGATTPSDADADADADAGNPYSRPNEEPGQGSAGDAGGVGVDEPESDDVVEAVTPRPEDVDGPDDDTEQPSDSSGPGGGGDDHSGPGSGGDDHSGPGGGDSSGSGHDGGGSSGSGSGSDDD